jgi:hypothetical protein
MLNSSSISLFSMSVLKKIQFADAMMIGIADAVIIGAGTAECQKSVCVPADLRGFPCSIAAR